MNAIEQARNELESAQRELEQRWPRLYRVNDREYERLREKVRRQREDLELSGVET